MKIFNLADPKNAKHFLRPRFETMLKEISAEVEAIVPVKKAHVITSKNACIGAECGSIFIELETKEDSETLLESLTGKNYEKNDIKAVCVPEEAYVDYYIKIFDNGAF